jgi:hypothetical protein
MRTCRAFLVVVSVGLLVGADACAPTSSAPTSSAPEPSLSASSSPAQSLTASPPSTSGAVGSAVREFNGHIVCGPPIRSETSTQAGDHLELRGGAWKPTATEMSDRRLEGDYTISTNSNVYPASGSTEYELLTGTWRIETTDGAWEASYTRIGFSDGSVSTVTTPLVGEGAYDGLVAVWEARYPSDAACEWDIRGVIFPAGPPPPPIAPNS